MTTLNELLKERDEIVSAIKLEWEEGRSREERILKRLRKKVGYPYYPNNWAYIVDYKLAHSNDGMKFRKINPCPMCLGEKKMRQYNNDIVRSFEGTTDCPLCKGSGVAWFKYGTFEISDGRDYGRD